MFGSLEGSSRAMVHLIGGPFRFFVFFFWFGFCVSFWSSLKRGESWAYTQSGTPRDERDYGTRNFF